MAECCCSFLQILTALLAFWLVWVLFLKSFINEKRNSFFTDNLITLTKLVNDRPNSRRKKIFSDLHKMAAENGGKPLQITEIKAGIGVNFAYLPDKSEITCFNHHDIFLSLLPETARKFPNIKVVSKFGESENMECIKSGSQDAVICTHVLCHVNDVYHTFMEIIRILKPGGKLILYEHIQAPTDTWEYTFQTLFHGVWKWIGDKCDLKMQTDKIIHKVGFQSVEVELFKDDELIDGLSLPYNLHYGLKMVKYSVAGVATK